MKAGAAPTIADREPIAAGSAQFWRLNVALFSAAFCTFALIYCVQPIMPVFAETFRVTAAMSSLSLSLTTGVLAAGILFAGALSEVSGRKPLMGWSLLISALLTLGAALAPTWRWLLLARVLTGIAITGMPGVAMAYVSEEVERKASGLAMGLYVGGTAVGGMGGRIIVGFLTDLLSWRWAVGVIGLLSVCGSVMFWTLLPASHRFVPHRPRFSELLAVMTGHLRDRALPWLFLMGALLMGSFVSVFNYIGFRLVAPPYGLSQSAVGLLFTVYLIGTMSSAWSGHLAGKRGSRAVLWATVAVMLAGVLTTLAHPLPIIIAGVAIMTFGFFGSHTVVSAWVGRRAVGSKALATSLYLFCFYTGSSVIGTATGRFWAEWGWGGVVAAVSGVLLVGLAISVRLRSVPKISAL